MNAKQKMQRSRIALLLDEPFFGSLLLGLQPREDKDGTVAKTMATDGVSLWWNTERVGKWSEAEIKTVLAHEALHCALLHPLRRGDRQPEQWNIACDHAVNLILEACNDEAREKGKAPPFVWPHDCAALMDKAHVGKSAEEIYCAAPERSGGGDGDGQGGGMGDVLDAPVPDPASKDALEAQWKMNVVQAAAAAKARGTVPAGMRALVDELLNPRVNWRETLRQFIRSRAADDYSFARPNMRYAASGFILPSLRSERLGTIAIIRDTSGSTQDWQKEILAELAGLMAEARPEKVIVIDADACVQRVLELEPGDALPTDALGGGGTDFRPALTELEKHEPVCAVYLTDLAGTFPDVEPAFPVLWATDSDDRAPFGDTIKI